MAGYVLLKDKVGNHKPSKILRLSHNGKKALIRDIGGKLDTIELGTIPIAYYQVTLKEDVGDYNKDEKLYGMALESGQVQVFDGYQYTWMLMEDVTVHFLEAVI